jgi:hypothetical protein
MRHRALILGAALGVAILAALGFYLYTPTIAINIHNNTAQQVTVSTCGSDPQTIGPGRSAVVDPNPNDPHAACVVYEGNTNAELGCLPIPATEYRNGDTVNLSKLIRGVPAGKCGD